MAFSSIPSQSYPPKPHQPTKTVPSNVTITPVTSTSLTAYRRLITTLLPIRYPDKFYKDSIANSTSSSLALCALWHHATSTGKQNYEAIHGSIPSPNYPAEPTVVGGIQCRLEPRPTAPSESFSARSTQVLYIQTLAVLSPYRSLGIASRLLDTVIATAIAHYSTSADNVSEIYAHVWEANVEAVEWYARRGFVVEPGLVEGYYRKLKPSGARVVRRRLGVGDWLRVKDLKEDDDGRIVGGDGNINGQREDERMANG